MRITRTARHAGSAGLTLLEMMVAVSILGLVGYTLVRAVEMGSNSQDAVQRTIGENEAIRSTASDLRNELKATGDAVLTVATLADGNHQVTFPQPIVVGGDPAWGIYDPLHGADEEAHNLEGWNLRYTVDSIPIGAFDVNRRLLRQVVDELGAVQDEDILVEGLRAGGDDPPGFTVVQVGDVWEITLTMVGYDAAKRGRGTVFHVRTRN